MYKKKYLIIIILIITGFVILFFLNKLKKNNSEINNTFQSTLDELKKYDTEIAAIPEADLYYYYQGKKIKLWRKQDKEFGVYLSSSQTYDPDKIKVGSELILKYRKDISPEEISTFLSKENLLASHDKLLSDGNMDSVYITSTSRFNNALQEANYLSENYQNILNFASADFTYFSTGSQP